MPPAVAGGLPEPALQIAADHDGLRWTFLEQRPEDLRRLYGLEVTDEIVWLPLLETVSIDAPGRIPSDNCFHLLTATPSSVQLQQYCDQAAPLGKVASVDFLGTATITPSA